MTEQRSPLTLINATHRRQSPFLVSFVVQAIVVLFLVEIGLIRPVQFEPVVRLSEAMMLVAPVPQRPAPPPPPQLVAMTKPPVVTTTPTVRLPAIRPTRVAEPARIPAPQLRTTAPVPSLPKAPAPVIQVVQTGVFNSSGSQAVATTARPAKEVQTGGFGDPNGIKGEGKANGRANIARAGGFDLPVGGGQGNGTGGTKGARGTVASVGFGNGIAVGNVSQIGPRAIQQGGFGDSRPAEAQRPQRVSPVVASTTPVQILSKPNPVYTEEARALHLEGEVLLRVEFGATGELRVLQVIRGLGHGLDEAATRSARQIRFRPATEDGRPVTSIAALHVVFQMAY